MATPPRISIVIPTFNRGDLIKETLDSVQAQTYKSWECIVVDDGSTDNTAMVLNSYQEKDGRIQYIKRPEHLPKGANTCRNLGIEKAGGDYIVFFDSDDLMTPDHLEVKLKPFEDEAIDFTIAKTEFFNKPSHKRDHRYSFHLYPITLNNYLGQKINWLTLDACIKAPLVKKIRFNETLMAGQEFNFYSKLLQQSTKGIFIDKVVSLRRYHEDSVQYKLVASNSKRISSFLTRWGTYQDLKTKLSLQEKKTILYSCMKVVAKLKRVPEGKWAVMGYEVFSVYGVYGFYFLAMLLSMQFNRTGFLLSKLERKST